MPLYCLQVVQTRDGVELIVDWKETPEMGPEAPILLILHGVGERTCLLGPTLHRCVHVV